MYIKTFIFLIGFTFIYCQAYAENTIETPDKAIIKVINQSLIDIRKLQNEKKIFDIEDIKTLLEKTLLDNVSAFHAAEFALREYWLQLSPLQQKIAQQYLFKSIINDYTNIIFISQSDLSNIVITANPNIKRKANKAIIKLNIQLSTEADPLDFILRVVYEKKWLIYDIAVSGVSLMKSYRARFKSQIKRKGLENFFITLASNL